MIFHPIHIFFYSWPNFCGFNLLKLEITVSFFLAFIASSFTGASPILQFAIPPPLSVRQNRGGVWQTEELDWPL